MFRWKTLLAGIAIVSALYLTPSIARADGLHHSANLAAFSIGQSVGSNIGGQIGSIAGGIAGVSWANSKDKNTGTKIGAGLIGSIVGGSIGKAIGGAFGNAVTLGHFKNGEETSQDFTVSVSYQRAPMISASFKF